MNTDKSLPKLLSRIFAIALAANTVLVVILLLLGISIRQSGIKLMDEMGGITLQAFKAARPMFWGPRGIDSPMMRDFINELAEQQTVRNVFVYDTARQVVFSYIDPEPDYIRVPPPRRPVYIGNSMFIYTQGGQTFSGGGRGMAAPHHFRNGENSIIVIELDASSVRRTAKLRNISFFIALLMQLVLLLFYTRLRRMINAYDDSQRHMQTMQQEATTGRLASILAHEIKNPLSSIKGLVGYARKKSTDEQVVDNLRRSEEEVDRLTGIVNGFLNFGRPMDLDKTEFSVSDLCQKAVMLVSHDIQRRNNRVEITGDDFILEGDYNSLLQVLVNLIINALDAAPPGTAVKIVLDGHERSLALINEVTDVSGVDRDKLFEPFYTTKAQGSGLGLSVAKKIIDIHGYHIEVSGISPFTVRIEFR